MERERKVAKKFREEIQDYGQEFADQMDRASAAYEEKQQPQTPSGFEPTVPAIKKPKKDSSDIIMEEVLKEAEAEKNKKETQPNIFKNINLLIN